MPYSCRKLWSWAQPARRRVLRHRRSEGISSIQLFESSRYWGLREQRAVSRGQEEGYTGQESTRHLASEGAGPRHWDPCKRPRGPENSLSLEVMGGPVQTHDQIFFPRFQVKAARSSNQKVSGLTGSGLGVLG